MKVIFFDIDGTICDFDGTVPDSAIRGMKAAQKAGHKIALCSGRSEVQIDKAFLDIGFDAVVSAAGAHVTAGGETVLERYIPRDRYHALLDAIYEDIPGMCVQTNEHVYVSEEGYPHLEAAARILFADEAGEDGEAPDIRRGMGDLFCVPSLYEVEKPQKMFYHMAPLTVDEVSARLGDAFCVLMLSFKEPNPRCGEITIHGVEKSTGMDALMRYYGLTREDAVCFGDGPNDFDMMAYAGLGICMGNGLPELKKQADYVTDTVKNDGLYKGLAHFGLL